MQKIHNYLFKFKKYIEYTLEIMDYHNSRTATLTSYDKFNHNASIYQNSLTNLYEQINKITPFSFSVSKISQIGHIMHTFYQLYENKEYNDAFLYSFGFHGYFTLINQINLHVQENKIVKTTFTKKGKPIFKQMYYPKFIDNTNNNIIKNNCNLNKNMIITGPNASGKTTTLKTALINIILSQQIGFGCFDSLKLCPYDHLHCYLNIPDTSGRDSLFQAEARRCKEIIDSIETFGEYKHFCIFDELYSGTNPEEAITSASAFMNYIVKHDNVTCLLTTHYVKLCKKLAKNAKIQNYNMKSLKKNDNFEYTYLLEKGISKIKGGLKILKDMNYPQEILDNTK
jgi:DNA mismatch repair ATPase MutS